jgi:hypothetical protein
MAQSLKDRSNGIDPEISRGYLERIANVMEEVLSEQGRYMAIRKKLMAERNAILDEAKDRHGIPKKNFKEGLDVLDTGLKLRKKVSDMEADDRAVALDIIGENLLEVLQEALSDFAELPLGRAAIEAAGGPKVDDDGAPWPDDDVSLPVVSYDSASPEAPKARSRSRRKAANGGEVDEQSAA